MCDKWTLLLLRALLLIVMCHGSMLCAQTPDGFVEVEIIAKDTIICEGDTVILCAEGRQGDHVLNTPRIAIGDVLCTDNSIVKPSQFAACGKQAMGIVFYVDKTGEHGWAVELIHSSPESIKWSTRDVDVAALPNRSMAYQAAVDYDGYTNTKLIRAAGSASDFPAAYIVDFAHDWYLPAAGQLSILFAHLPALENSLDILEATGTQVQHFDGWYYWSSTEATLTTAWLEFAYGNVNETAKNVVMKQLRVVAVRSF